jgi:hypothetical protein
MKRGKSSTQTLQMKKSKIVERRKKRVSLEIALLRAAKKSYQGLKRLQTSTQPTHVYYAS